MRSKSRFRFRIQSSIVVRLISCNLSMRVRQSGLMGAALDTVANCIQAIAMQSCHAI